MATIVNLNKQNTFLEYFISTNEFNQPKVYSDEHATYVMLVRLILLEPGTYPTRPNMGVGLVSKYRFALEDSITELEQNISDQISTYLPEFSAAEVTVSFDKTKKTAIISININQYVYEMTYIPETNELSAVNE